MKHISAQEMAKAKAKIAAYKAAQLQEHLNEEFGNIAEERIEDHMMYFTENTDFIGKFYPVTADLRPPRNFQNHTPRKGLDAIQRQRYGRQFGLNSNVSRLSARTAEPWNLVKHTEHELNDPYREALHKEFPEPLDLSTHTPIEPAPVTELDENEYAIFTDTFIIKAKTKEVLERIQWHFRNMNAKEKLIWVGQNEDLLNQGSLELNYV